MQGPNHAYQFGRRQQAATEFFFAAAIVEQRHLVWIDWQAGSLGAAARQGLGGGQAVRVLAAAQGKRLLHAAPADVENQGQNALRYVGVLAHAVAIEANEQRVFSSQIQGEVFAGLQRRKQRFTYRVKLLAHLLKKAPRAHACPPNTSTPRNKHGGEACPTRITWLGSPLPQ